MKNIIEQKVFYSDTDAYGVVWHGAYLRWLEMGRVEWCEMTGHNLIELERMVLFFLLLILISAIKRQPD